MTAMTERARIDWVADRLGLALTAARPIVDGQRRALYADLAGAPVVVKWGLDPDLPEKLPYVAGQVPELRRRGIPVPQILAHGPLDDNSYGWVLERLPGAPATAFGEPLLGDLIGMITRMAAAPPGPHRNDLGYWVPAAVFEDAAGYWRTAMAIGPAVAGFCQRLRAWAGRPSSGQAPGHGYVHVDLNLSNVLVDDAGRLSGIIDTEHLGVGDRCVDLARLAFEWHWLARTGTAGLAADGMGRLAALGRALSGDAWWRVAVAYELISRVGWRSEHHTEVDPLTWLPACAEFLDAPAIQ